MTKLPPCKRCGGEKLDRGLGDKRICMCKYDVLVRERFRIGNEPEEHPLLWCGACHTSRRFFRRGLIVRAFLDFAIIYPTRPKTYNLRCTVEVWGCAECGFERVWGIKEIEDEPNPTPPAASPYGRQPTPVNN